jgi:hypothetical protein
VEAAHVGSRGLGQKSSDFETIPLASVFHKEQHRIGLRAFCRTYDLDIPALLAMLNEKPRLKVWDARYIGFFRDETISLGYVEQGLNHSIWLLKDRMREILSEEILKRIAERVR